MLCRDDGDRAALVYTVHCIVDDLDRTTRCRHHYYVFLFVGKRCILSSRIKVRQRVANAMQCILPAIKNVPAVQIPVPPSRFPHPGAPRHNALVSRCGTANILTSQLQWLTNCFCSVASATQRRA